MDGFGFNMPWNMANNNHHYPNPRYNNRYLNHRDNNHRNNNNRGGGGNGGGGNVPAAGGRHDNGDQRYVCCKCGDFLQNSEEHGVHLCGSPSIADSQDMPQVNISREMTAEEVQSNLGESCGRGK
jgi:hypothetical protein